MTATIEIRARDVERTHFISLINDLASNYLNVENLGRPQHLYIIYTSSNGEQTILRGGPALGNEFLDNLGIIKAPFDEANSHLFPGDLAKTDKQVEIARGTDAEMQAMLGKMWYRAQEINAGNYDYKFPIFGCGFCHVQNSNTVVKELIKAAGLVFQLYKYGWA